MDGDTERELEPGVRNILGTPRVQQSRQLESELESVVECPVCYNIPRDLPIPCCPAGGIVIHSFFYKNNFIRTTRLRFG